MEEILNKISSYNIFNCLLPGTVFAIIGDSLTSYPMVQDDLLVAFFLYYFFGLVISRVGSMVIQPFLQKLKIIKTAPYSDYLDAEKSDGKIAELLEASNTYRTLIALILVLSGLIGFERLAGRFTWLGDNAMHLFLVFLLALFILAYRKQTRYIVGRVNKDKS